MDCTRSAPCATYSADLDWAKPSQQRANNPNRPLRVSRLSFPNSDPPHRPSRKTRSFRNSRRAWRVHRLGFHFVLSSFSWRCLGNMTLATRPCEYKVSTVRAKSSLDKRVPLAREYRVCFLPTTFGGSRPHRCRFLKNRLNKITKSQWQRAWEIDTRATHFKVHRGDKYTCRNAR